MTLKTKINLSIVAFIILTIFIIVFLIPHLFSEIKKSSRELISQKEKLAEFQAMTEDLEKFKSDYPEIKENLEKIIMSEAEAGDRGKLLWPLRAALTGKESSAGPFEIAELLGKEKTLKRIKEAYDLSNTRA